MRRGKRTFSKVIRFYILVTLFLTLLFYTFVLHYYMGSGSWLAASFELEMLGRRYEQSLDTNPNTPFPKLFNIRTYDGYGTLPVKIRQYFPSEAVEAGELYEVDLEELEGLEPADKKGLEFYYLILPYKLKSGKMIFLVQSFESEDEESKFFEDIDDLSFITFVIAGVCLCLFVIIVWYLGKRMTRPSEDLAEWAKNLSSTDLDKPIPDFSFKEFNDVAEELHNSMVRIDQFVAREREFLRQASHELRTPVTVISGNTELLAKHDLPSVQQRIIGRIDRAAHNMKQLIETLLWLGREIDPVSEVSTVNLTALVQDILDELNYLHKDGHVECRLNVKSPNETVTAYSTAAYIVVSNLLRNAFQHTPQGYIAITVCDGVISVENHIDSSAHCAAEKLQGHGIGLKLVHQVCQRCQWDIQTTDLSGGGLRAVLNFIP